MRYLFSVALVLLLSACVTTTTHYGRRPNLSALSQGMTETEVVAIMGKPAKVAVHGRSRYLHYGWDSPWDGRVGATEEYFVRLVDGKVDSFGERGDFDSTKDPTININRRDTTPVATDVYSDLLKLKSLLDAGAITQGEYDRQKAILLND